jgi:hypothetical protein
MRSMVISSHGYIGCLAHEEHAYLAHEEHGYLAHEEHGYLAQEDAILLMRRNMLKITRSTPGAGFYLGYEQNGVRE